MKILFAKSTIAGPVSGADEIIVRYAVELKKAGNSTQVLLVHAPPESLSQVVRLNDAEIPVSTLASTAFSTSLALGRKAALGLINNLSPASSAIRRFSHQLVYNLVQRYHGACCEFLLAHKPDVVHVMTPDPGAVMIIRAAHAVRIPVIYHEAGVPFHPPGFEEVYARLAAVLPLCTEVAALSPRLARQLNDAVSGIKPVQVLPLISHSEPAEHENLKPPTDKIIFGFAARLEHLKGALAFVQAFVSAFQTRPNIELRIAGDGSQRKSIIETIKKFGLEDVCRLVGVYQSGEERARFMQSIDVFVLPSLTEGTPNAIIEAMAHGKPIVATDVGGVADVVTPDVGILIAAGDTAALTAAMVKLATNREMRKQMGRAAQAKYEREFTATAVLPLLADFYERVVHQYAGDFISETAARRESVASSPTKPDVAAI